MSSLLGHLTIRWRLAALSGGITFLVLCGFAMIIGQLTASRIRSDFNHEVAAAVDDLRDQLELDFVSGDVVVANDIPTFAAPNRAAIRVLNAGSGRIIAQTPKAPNFGLPAIAVGRTAQVGGWRVETRRAVLKPVNTPKGATIPPVPVFVQYARKVSDVEATVDRVRLFLVLGVLVGTGLALALAAALSRRALAPIARLTATARDIGRTQDTSRRVPIPDSEDEVAELARTLDEMLRSLETSRSETEETLQRQRQFVADASHELRTPLTAVLANLELLADVLDGERGEAAHAALRSTQRMRRLVADLLLLARADAKREVTHKPTELDRVVVEAASEIGALTADHELTVDVQPVVVDGARDELHRLALNLMENAVRHTPAGTNVHVVVRADGDQAVLTVSDDGPGVPEELRDQIFERFVRAAGDRGGSVGLGLSIVKAVARSHGGDVRLENSPGGGACFVVTLPRITVREPAAEPVPA